MRDFNRSRFDQPSDQAMGLDLPNLADLMLVFVTGLIAALATATGSFSERQIIERTEMSREIAELPASAEANGEGLEPMGRVFKDPQTGKLYVIK
ncbi:MAG: hypothetical protein AAGA84_08180 [Pseudomonadota bacterium]